jgi:hypothetical protein
MPEGSLSPAIRGTNRAMLTHIKICNLKRVRGMRKSVVFIFLCLLFLTWPFFGACTDEEFEPFGLNLSVSCAAAVPYYAQLNPALVSLLPPDGEILSADYTVSKKTTALGLLRDALRQEEIHYDIFGGYVRGINNLYEKALGTQSGWIIFVNGAFLTLGADSYTVQAGDNIEWKYTVRPNDSE